MRDKEVFVKKWDVELVRIDRLTPWGNPFITGIDGERNEVIDQYVSWLGEWQFNKKEREIKIGARVYSNKWVMENIHILKGKDLACWCAPEKCHGDILLRLANGG
jgi:hypothetical protein